MKDWYDNLQARERIYVLVGAACLIILLFYLIAWAPIANSVSDMREITKRQQSDLSWMQTASQQIRTLQRSNPRGRGSSNRSLLSVVDQSISGAGLKGALQRMEPEGKNTVKVWLNQGAFDALISMLGNLEQNDGINIKALSITPVDVPGLVDARITLTR